MLNVIQPLLTIGFANENDKPDKGDILMKVLGDKRQERWDEIVSNFDFTHSSRKAWAAIQSPHWKR